MWPDYNALITQCWGYPSFENSAWCGFGAASNIVVGANPPYFITDLWTLYPKFAGKTLALTGTSDGSATVTGIDTTGITPGQYVSSPALPPGTTIVSLGSSNQNGSATLSNAAILTGVQPFTIYVGPPLMPIQVIMAYIALASASLVYARWLDTWAFAMALYVAHFLTLYLRSEGNCASACGQAAVAGLKSGITVGFSAGGVSQSLKPVPGIDEWGAWTQTAYGVQLIQFAKGIGSGPVWIY